MAIRLYLLSFLIALNFLYSNQNNISSNLNFYTSLNKSKWRLQVIRNNQTNLAKHKYLKKLVKDDKYLIFNSGLGAINNFFSYPFLILYGIGSVLKINAYYKKMKVLDGLNYKLYQKYSTKFDKEFFAKLTEQGFSLRDFAYIMGHNISFETYKELVKKNDLRRKFIGLVNLNFFAATLMTTLGVSLINIHITVWDHETIILGGISSLIAGTIFYIFYGKSFKYKKKMLSINLFNKKGEMVKISRRF